MRALILLVCLPSCFLVGQPSPGATTALRAMAECEQAEIEQTSMAASYRVTGCGQTFDACCDGGVSDTKCYRVPRTIEEQVKSFGHRDAQQQPCAAYDVRFKQKGNDTQEFWEVAGCGIRNSYQCGVSEAGCIWCQNDGRPDPSAVSSSSPAP
jgi:hypothetical protein